MTPNPGNTPLQGGKRNHPYNSITCRKIYIVRHDVYNSDMHEYPCSPLLFIDNFINIPFIYMCLFMLPALLYTVRIYSLLVMIMTSL